MRLNVTEKEMHICVVLVLLGSLLECLLMVLEETVLVRQRLLLPFILV